MKAEKFNQLSIEEKFKFIKQQVRGQEYSLCNQLIFKDKVITYLFGALNGSPGFADAEELPDEYQPMFKRLLEANNKHCLNVMLDQHPAYKNRVFQAVQARDNRTN